MRETSSLLKGRRMVADGESEDRGHLQASEALRTSFQSLMLSRVSFGPRVGCGRFLRPGGLWVALAAPGATLATCAPTLATTADSIALVAPSRCVSDSAAGLDRREGELSGAAQEDSPGGRAAYSLPRPLPLSRQQTPNRLGGGHFSPYRSRLTY